MLNRKLNEAHITFELKTTGPLLIKQGEDEEEEKKPRQNKYNTGKEHTLYGADMIFIHLGDKPDDCKFYIPGSSIKGMMRSWCEKIVRTLYADKCCDPFEGSKIETLSCSEKFVRLADQAQEHQRVAKTLKEYSQQEGLEEEMVLDGRVVYHFACPICKLFGCMALASRLKVNDAFPIGVGDNPNAYWKERLVMRDGIAIDRFTGGVKSPPEGGKGGAKFDYQVLQDVRFGVSIEIQNFELWQLGLLGFFFRDLQQQYVSIGYGKTRGLGSITCEKLTVDLSYVGVNASLKPSEAHGIGVLLGDDVLASKYGLILDDRVTGLTGTEKPVGSSGLARLRKTFVYPAQNEKGELNSFFATIVPKWVGLGSELTGYIDIYNTEKEVGDPIMLKARGQLMSSSNFKPTLREKTQSGGPASIDEVEERNGKD
jgi:CRISPR/Cas system CSM-associated protein Csm3 (group 7 of RAMP superfamily)